MACKQEIFGFVCPLRIYPTVRSTTSWSVDRINGLHVSAVNIKRYNNLFTLLISALWVRRIRILLFDCRPRYAQNFLSVNLWHSNLVSIHQHSVFSYVTYFILFPQTYMMTYIFATIKYSETKVWGNCEFFSIFENVKLIACIIVYITLLSWKIKVVFDVKISKVSANLA